MTQLIIDESTCRTPIGELLSGKAADVIELRTQTGELLGTLLLPDRSNEERYQEIEQQLAAESDVIQERLSRPPSQGLTTPEFLEKLQKLCSEA